LWRVPAGALLYHVRRPAAWVLHLGQALAFLYAVIAANVVGLTGILGLRPVVMWLKRERHVPSEPEAQGPALAPDGRLAVSGPFRYSRHPLNLAPVPIFWLWPRMTFKLLVFNLASTVYLVLGSLHEEARLRAAYGRVYDEYAQSDVPFYLPRVPVERILIE
jgi:protein-S-isoprenylcysteine O-methyltransferase Ste14